MLRATCIAAALTFAAAAILPAQTRSRDTSFGRPEAEWCRDIRDADVCEVREETVQNTSTIDIDGGGNGGVSIRGWDRNDVRVRVRIAARSRNRSDAEALAKATRLITADGRIRVDGPRTDNRRRGSRWDDGEWWSASYEVEVPRGARVTADATNGGLSFYDVSGDVRGRATNGGVTVELTGDRWQGAGLDVQTTNGGVRMTLPANFSAELEARSSNGGISIDFPITLKDLNSRRDVRGTLGSGGPLVRATTTNGGITIRRR